MAHVVAFTATGDPLTEASSGGETIPAGDQINTNSGATTDDELIGFAFKGFSAVEIHDGTDASGPLVAYASAPGTISWNEPIRLTKGLWIVVTGTGSGSVWLA